MMVFPLLHLLACMTAWNAAFGLLRPGEPSKTHTCGDIRKVPNELVHTNMSEIFRPEGINKTFYKRYTEAYGIPILGSKKVSKSAVKRACYTVRFMLADHAGLRRAMYKLGGRVALMARDEVTLDIPEHSDWDPFWNTRARGLGGTITLPITTGGEENVLCDNSTTDPYSREDILLHEFAHSLDQIAARVMIPDWSKTMDDTYDKAKAEGLWNGTYAMTTSLEYFAEGVQSYFSVNDQDTFNHNHVSTKSLLKDYDRRLFKIIKQLFPCRNKYLKRCKTSRGREDRQVLKMDCNKNDNDLPDFLIEPTCEDKKGAFQCLDWAMKGECENNPSYMNSNCANSCKQCPDPNCMDNNGNCAGWAGQGECDKNPGWMHVNCKKSCNKC